MIIAPMPETTRALRLTDWGVIRASGPDAATVLHGQLTQDFALLGDAQARLAGYCTPKGRLLATLVGWRESPGSTDLLLALPLELLPATLKRLSMFVMRAKCKLSDASEEFAVCGLLGEGGEAWSLTRELDRVRIALPGPARSLLIQPATDPEPNSLSAQDWAWAEIEAGQAWVRSATVEAFVPQMLNLEALGGVSFKKGCYPGQEIVARSQYRGTIKRRTLMFSTDAEAQIGQEVFHSDDPGQPAGQVAGVARRDGQTLLLAEVKLAALEAGSLHLSSAEGPVLRPQPLPYDFPAEV